MQMLSKLNKKLLKSIILQAIGIVLVGVILGFGSNIMRADTLAIVRVPLSQSREMVKIDIPEETKKNDIKEEATNIDEQILDSELENIEKQNETADKNDKIATPEEQEKTQPKPEEKKKEIIEPKKPDVKEKPPQALFVSLDDAKKLYDSGNAIFIDSRIIEEYNEEHITGAISFDVYNIDLLYQKLLGNVSKDKMIVTYCSDIDCGSSTQLADKLVLKGHKNVMIMIDGIPAWRNAGFPTTSE